MIPQGIPNPENQMCLQLILKCQKSEDSKG